MQPVEIDRPNGLGGLLPNAAELSQLVEEEHAEVGKRHLACHARTDRADNSRCQRRPRLWPAVAQRLGDVQAAHGGGAVEVGQRARDAQRAVPGAG